MWIQDKDNRILPSTCDLTQSGTYTADVTYDNGRGIFLITSDVIVLLQLRMKEHGETIDNHLIKTVIKVQRQYIVGSRLTVKRFLSTKPSASEIAIIFKTQIRKRRKLSSTQWAMNEAGTTLAPRRL